jgi:transposase InsO family protein
VLKVVVAVLVELRVVEQRFAAVQDVLNGVPVTEVARRCGVSRQTVHRWLARYADAEGLTGLADRSCRPSSCPHQMPAELEARVVEARIGHPAWGPARIVFEIGKGGGPVPSRSGVYRALIRHRLIDPTQRKRKRSDYRRWERDRPMELWQMDVMGGVHLTDGRELKVITGIDDYSRFVVSAKLVLRATAQPVCQALREALQKYGLPEQILTDNGKVFTARFGPGPGPVMFDQICHENGIRHLLTAPYSPTTTGKVERLHKTMRKEHFSLHDREFPTMDRAQAALDAWLEDYNTARPSLGVAAAVA